jgi:predicted permease
VVIFVRLSHQIDQMTQYVHMVLFFLGTVGSTMFFGIRFSRLALDHGKNRWVYGFIGAACFLACVRFVGFVATGLELQPGSYAPSYIMLAVSFLISFGVYHLIRRNWEKFS